MSGYWQLQEAKSKFSEVVNKAVEGEPQVITRHGVETAVVLSYEMYHKLSSQGVTLSEYFRQSPLAEIELDFSRSTDPVREIRL